MECPTCGTAVRDGQKFCMECGTSLRGVTDATQEVGAVAASRSAFGPPTDQRRMGREDATVRMPVTSAAVPDGGRREATTSELTVVPASSTSVRLQDTAPVPGTEQWVAEEPSRPPRTFRLRPLLLLTLFGVAATAVGSFTTMITIEASTAGAFDVGTFAVNDFGSNNTVAGLLAAGTMVVGALAWCFGFRWGAGLAGGAGAALAGWVALVVGVAEWPIFEAESAAELVPSTITRDVGYWALVGAGGVGLLVLLVSVARSGRRGRSGLDPWIAALGAVSFLVAAGGPLIPEGSADWSANFSSETLGVDLPTLLFVGRAVQLGLLALCGVVGFLLVRRWGLGLAVGSAVAAAWLLVTAATEQTESPIGPGYANPGAADLQPHAMTVVGMALVGFFSLVAIVMALLDADR